MQTEMQVNKGKLLKVIATIVETKTKTLCVTKYIKSNAEEASQALITRTFPDHYRKSIANEKNGRNQHDTVMKQDQEGIPFALVSLFWKR